MIDSYPLLMLRQPSHTSSPLSAAGTHAGALEEEHGTADRMVHVEMAALALAEVVDDLIRDMEMIVLNLPPATKRTHELAQANRAHVLARALRSAVRDARSRY